MSQRSRNIPRNKLVAFADFDVTGDQMLKLDGRNALITGASSGIGQAIAVRFAREGANIAINYRSGAEQAEATRVLVRAARTGGGREIVIQADVSDEQQVIGMVARTIAEFGSLDVLINNAGI